MTRDTHTPVQNRSEIIFAYDGKNVNQNGNPLSAGDEPRIDEQTQQAIVTDVRLKRYLRDQLDEDGHGVFIRNVKDDEGNAPTREALLESITGITSEEDISEDVFEEFLDAAVDVRYFGATLSIKGSGSSDSLASAIAENLPHHLTGAVQFAPATSLNAVEINEEYNSLTSVIGTQEGKQEGGFDLDDNRIKYGMFNFYGRVNERSGEHTNLSEADVKRLDTLCWRALKNQTTSRSKMGHEPRLYIRVEYDGGEFHIGDLNQYITIDRANSKSDAQMRSVKDITLSIDDLVEVLSEHSRRVKAAHICADNALTLSHRGELGGEDLLREALESAIGYDSVRTINVWDEAGETKPGNTE